MNEQTHSDGATSVATATTLNFATARAIAWKIMREALASVDPSEAVRRTLRRDGDQLIAGGNVYDLRLYKRIIVVGAGKASAPMARALEGILGDLVSSGHVNVKYGYTDETRIIHLHEASHPVPDQAGLDGTAKIVELLHEATAEDLVICLISGGGSALMLLPDDGISLSDYRALTDLLLRSGADITRINTIRKHIERVKGGRLAELAAPATVLTLVLSDVVGNPLDFIASGPTVPDTTTFADAIGVLNEFDLLGRIPQSIEDALRRGERGDTPETPKPGNPLFDKARTVVIGSNDIAADAAIACANKLGFNTLMLTSFMEGEAREVARFAVAIGRELVHRHKPLNLPAMVVFGGETTVTVRGHGKGGRNQEIALSAALAMANVPRTLIVALATDGSDGPTDAAGGFADSGSLGRMRDAGIDPREALNANDSNEALARAGDLIVTGPTNTNVNDLAFVFVYPG